MSSKAEMWLVLFATAIVFAFAGFSVGVWITPAQPSKTEFGLEVRERFLRRIRPEPGVHTKPMPPTPPAELKAGRPESLGSGWVRAVDSYRGQVVYETDYGFMKAFNSICGYPIPMWNGMRLNQLNYHWQEYNMDSLGCYEFDYIGHAASGDLK